MGMNVALIFLLRTLFIEQIHEEDPEDPEALEETEAPEETDETEKTVVKDD